jgi:hypothetical protein
MSAPLRYHLVAARVDKEKKTDIVWHTAKHLPDPHKGPCDTRSLDLNRSGEDEFHDV